MEILKILVGGEIYYIERMTSLTKQLNEIAESPPNRKWWTRMTDK